MSIKKFKIIIAGFLLLLFFVPVVIGAQTESLKITSISENIFSGKGVTAQGSAFPFEALILSLKDDNNNLIYSINTISDKSGNWSASFDQPLKGGKYYVEALPSGGSLATPVKSETISVRGPFAFIIGIFSILVILLTFVFVLGWYASKVAEVKRYRRILMSQRDVASFYNNIHTEVERALKIVSSKDVTEAKINEIEYHLKSAAENLEEMKKFIIQGINMISKYDIIKNINKKFKINIKIFNKQ
jgi:hypothetical protein